MSAVAAAGAGAAAAAAAAVVGCLTRASAVAFGEFVRGGRLPRSTEQRRRRRRRRRLLLAACSVCPLLPLAECRKAQAKVACTIAALRNDERRAAAAAAADAAASAAFAPALASASASASAFAAATAEPAKAAAKAMQAAVKTAARLPEKRQTPFAFGCCPCAREQLPSFALPSGGH